MIKIKLNNRNLWTWLSDENDNNKRTIFKYTDIFKEYLFDKGYIVELQNQYPLNIGSIITNKLATTIPKKYFLEIQYCAMIYANIFNKIFPPLAQHVDLLAYIEWLLYTEPENMRYRDHLVHMFKVAYTGDCLLSEPILKTIINQQFNRTEGKEPDYFTKWLNDKNIVVKDICELKKDIIKMAFFLSAIFHDFGYGYYFLGKYHKKLSRINDWFVDGVNNTDMDTISVTLKTSLATYFIKANHAWLSEIEGNDKKEIFADKISLGFFRDCISLNHSISSCLFIINIAEKLHSARAIDSNLYVAFHLAAEATMIHDMTDKTNKRWMHLKGRTDKGHFLNKETQDKVPMAMLLILADELSLWERPRLDYEIGNKDVIFKMEENKSPKEVTYHRHSRWLD